MNLCEAGHPFWVAEVLEHPSMIARGLALRPITSRDASFLRALYETARSDADLVALLPASQREPFLDDQFRLQDIHYRRYYGDAAFLVIEQYGKPAGRLILDRSRAAWEIIDIAIVPVLRSQGIGSALIRAILEAAADAGATCVKLHVDSDRARTLYERLGFVKTGEAGIHIEMAWTPPVS